MYSFLNRIDKKGSLRRYHGVTASFYGRLAELPAKKSIGSTAFVRDATVPPSFRNDITAGASFPHFPMDAAS